MLLYFNLCLSVMLNILSCPFTSISFLTIWHARKNTTSLECEMIEITLQKCLFRIRVVSLRYNRISHLLPLTDIWRHERSDETSLHVSDPISWIFNYMLKKDLWPFSTNQIARSNQNCLIENFKAVIIT
jgi:hypothetical protein